MTMAIIDKTIQFSQDHINSARQELARTRQYLNNNEHDKQDMRNMLQKLKLMGDNGLSLSFGSILCNYIDSLSSLRNSQNALATHLSIALSFIAEALLLIDETRLPEVSTYSYYHNIRMSLSDIRFILSDYDTKQIPKDGIASAIARAETVARDINSSRFAEICDMLRGIRQTIAYY